MRRVVLLLSLVFGLQFKSYALDLENIHFNLQCNNKIFELNGTTLSHLVTIPPSYEAKGITPISNTFYSNITFFSGVFTPTISTYRRETSSWSDRRYPGLSIVNNMTYGSVAAFRDYVFATDHRTFNTGGEPYGLVRLQMANGDSTLRDDSFGQPIDVVIGLNGKLYTLSANFSSGDIQVRDPKTLVPLAVLSLPWGHDYRGIAVDRDGTIYLSTWGGMIFHFAADGSLINSKGIALHLNDIAIDQNGTIVVSNGYDGQYYILDSKLNLYQTVVVPQCSGSLSNFVSLGSIPCQRNKPTLSFDPIVIEAGQETLKQIKISNTDTALCWPAAAVSLNAVNDTNHFTTQPPSGLISLEPGESKNIQLKFQDANSVGEYSFDLIAYSPYMPYSKYNLPIKIVDTTAPTTPGNVSAHYSKSSTKRLMVVWSASTDNTQVKSYEISLNGTVLGQLPAVVRDSRNNLYMPPRLTYIHVPALNIATTPKPKIEVRAIDQYGNKSAPSGRYDFYLR